MIKAGTVILALLLILVAGSNAVSIYVAFFSEDERFNRQIEHQLSDVAKSHAERIDDYFNERKQDARFLEGSNRVRELLKSELSSEDFAAVADVDIKSRIVQKEIDNYLKANPKLTADDLWNLSEFREIAIRPVGETGYTTPLNLDDMVVIAHKHPAFDGLDINTLKEKQKEIYAITMKGVEEGYAEGFYNWTEPDGEVNRKFTNILIVPTRTADGKRVGLSTSTYVEEYKSIKEVPAEVDEHLKSFVKTRGYENMFLVSPDGYLIYVTGGGEGLGRKLERGGLDYALDIAFSGAPQNPEVIGPFFIGSDDSLYTGAVSPVYDRGELLGTVVLISGMEPINTIVTNQSGFGESGEIYLVNDDGFLISPLKHYDFDLRVQSVETECVDKCLKDFEEYGVSETDELILHTQDLFTHLNYRGALVLGTHAHITGPRWCLVAEISKEELFEIPRRGRLREEGIFNLSLSMLYMLVAGILKVLVDRKYVIKPQSDEQIAYEKGQIPRFFGELGFKYSFFIALAFSGVYFSTATLLFKDLKTYYYASIPALLTLVAASLLFMYSFKLKRSRARRFSLAGSGLIVLFNIIWIPVGQYAFIVDNLPHTHYLFTIALEFLGFVFLLLSLREVAYDNKS